MCSERGRPKVYGAVPYSEDMGERLRREFFIRSASPPSQFPTFGCAEESSALFWSCCCAVCDSVCPGATIGKDTGGIASPGSADNIRRKFGGVQYSTSVGSVLYQHAFYQSA